MPKKIYTNIPANYPVCVHDDCPQAATCLHHLAYVDLQKAQERLLLINPTMCKKDGNCTYYRGNQPVTYARGFTSFQKKMYPEQYQTFMNICLKRFSHNSYYERRRGDYALPPSEQKFILAALKKAGVKEEFKFDKYEQLVNWYD